MLATAHASPPFVITLARNRAPTAIAPTTPTECEITFHLSSSTVYFFVSSLMMYNLNGPPACCTQQIRAENLFSQFTAKVVKIYKLSVLSGFNKTKITDSELSFWARHTNFLPAGY
jgi:hypothetical protein